MTRDLRTSMFTEPRTLRTRMFENSGLHGWNLREQLAGSSSAAEADAIGEQQPKQTPSGSRVEADAFEEQQPKRTQSREATEADASGEKQLKRMQAGSSAVRSIIYVETDRCNRARSSS